MFSWSRGFDTVNEILAKSGMDVEKDCYIPGQRERYSFIRLDALILLLESQNPHLVCLENRERFLIKLLITLQVESDQI